MGNITDYIKWRGDLTFRQSPFNDVDNLILSELSYVLLDGIVPGILSDDSITLEKASEIFFKLFEERKLLTERTFTSDAPFIMKEMAITERYRGIRLSHYSNVIVEHQEKQFAAFHAALGDGTTYVAFRGTNDTIVGWKEDFNMSFLSPVPSQIEAMKYLNSTISFFHGKLRLGGHSKGGNLAIYAAVKCNPGVKRKIIDVYNNDGPGFDKEMISSPEYQQMLPKIKTIVPEASIIGMLLEHEENYMIVKSSQTGIMQHDANSWQVIGDHFITASELSRESQVLNKALNTWIGQLNKKEREDFVNTLFSIIGQTGALTLSDLNTDRIKAAAIMIRSFTSLDSATRNMMLRTLRSLGGAYNITKKKSNLIKSKKELK